MVLTVCWQKVLYFVLISRGTVQGSGGEREDGWKLGLFWSTLCFALWQQVLHFCQPSSTGRFAVCCLPPHPLNIWADLRSPGWLHRGLRLRLALTPTLWIADACDHAPGSSLTSSQQLCFSTDKLNYLFFIYNWVRYGESHAEVIATGKESSGEWAGKSHLWDKEESWWRKGQMQESKGLCLPSKFPCWNSIPEVVGGDLGLWELTRPAGQSFRGRD